MSKSPLRLFISLCGILAGTADHVLGQEALTLHWPRSQKQTSGVELTLEEVQRSPSRRGTQIAYRIVSKGFPRDKTYKLQISSSSSPTPATWVTSIEVSDIGSLTVGRVQNQPVEPSKLTIRIEDYNQGEFFMIEVVSEDGTVYARERV